MVNTNLVDSILLFSRAKLFLFRLFNACRIYIYKQLKEVLDG